MGLTASDLLSESVLGTAVATAVGMAVAIVYKVREWSGSRL